MLHNVAIILGCMLLAVVVLRLLAKLLPRHCPSCRVGHLQWLTEVRGCKQTAHLTCVYYRCDKCHTMFADCGGHLTQISVDDLPQPFREANGL